MRGQTDVALHCRTKQGFGRVTSAPIPERRRGTRMWCDPRSSHPPGRRAMWDRGPLIEPDSVLPGQVDGAA
jgi:hypothetical protein